MRGADRLWTNCAAVLQSQVSAATWRAWFDGVHPRDSEDDCLVLTVPNVVVKQRIEQRFLPMVQETLQDNGGSGIRLRLEIDAPPDDPFDEEDEVGVLPAPHQQGFGPPNRSGVDELTPTTRNGNRMEGRAIDGLGPRGWVSKNSEPRDPAAIDPDSPLGPNYTFEAFVIGESNRFACAAALSAAETPARSYNPLFIYGGAGLGKTHLLHAIGNYVREQYPGRYVKYVSTETFMNEFVDSIRGNTGSAFKKRYRQCDVLLVDDIQFMEGKEGLQEEFFHTFNTLYQASSQIVLTSDKHPRSISTLEDRLRSRFMSGLITDVQPPELETRLAILRKKAEGDSVHVPGEVLSLIATNVKDNIRELEGALTRVIAYASLNHEALTLPLAEKVLGDVLEAGEPRPITPKVILAATSEMFGFTIDELCGPSRRRPLVTARQISMYVFRELTDFSYPAIAREFGGRDHTTVIHAVDKISGLMKEKRQIYEQVIELMQQVRGSR